MSGAMEGSEGMDDDLCDDRLRRALAHAPDHGAMPDWRTRKTILEQAHEAVAPSLPAAPSRPARAWWQRLLGLGGPGGDGRMPWNAAFATVLIAVLVTVLWQREPVPGARLDGEAPAAAPPGAAAESPSAPAAAAAPAAPVAEPPPAPAAVPAPSPQASERVLPSSEDIPGTPLPPPAAASSAAAGAAGAAASRDASPEGLRRETERSASTQRFAAPSAPAPGAARDAVEAQRPAAAAPAAPVPRAAEPGELPSFAALSQWSRMTITPRGGTGRSLSRRDAMELNALIGSAALSAVGPQPLAGAVEWRVTLERANGDVLATFELGRNQVRWREGQKPATTGAPSAGSLAALRAALQQALEPPAPAPPLRWRPSQPPADPAGEPAAGPTAPPETAPPR
ncbi:hypothetical protein GCM10023165_42670 [Variovorax defluvii]|uniref:Meckel syndrome type 1 protein n=1 Tax=Variovorax defluvii TaxID=913761 RepID=A0ABP8I7A4_9BURK